MLIKYALMFDEILKEKVYIYIYISLKKYCLIFIFL